MAKPYAVGIDIGGTKIAAGVVDRSGKVLNRFTTGAHAEQPPDAVIGAVEQAYAALLQPGEIKAADVEAVGIGFAGNTNGPAGVVLVSSNMPDWDLFPLRDVVSRKLGVPVVLDNDTNVCAVGEHRYGAGRGCTDMCYVTWSTGLGLGIIVDNRLVTGHTGTAGELGHVVIDVNGPPCTCGKRGCLMAYGSGIGISRMVLECLDSGAATSLRDRVRPGNRRVTAELVAEVAAEGDESAQRIIATAGRYCGIALSMIVQLLNPQRIVVGGGLTRIGPALMDPAMESMRQHTQPQMWDSVQVVPWQLEDDVGIVGAAARALMG